MLNLIELHFFYHHVANLHFPASACEHAYTPALFQAWETLSEHSKGCLHTVDVTTKPPPRYDQVLSANINILTGVGDRLFQRGSGLYVLTTVPAGGYVWIGRHPTMPAVNLYWMHACPAPLPHRRYNIVFDLDDTLIFNPPCPSPEPLYYVNQTAPHRILDEPLDTPVMRPHIQEFLELICKHFETVRVCTLSLKPRAKQIVELLDPMRRTLLRNSSNGAVERCIVSREDVADVFSEPTRSSIVAGKMPDGVSPKTFEALQLPPNTTVIVDDSPQGWPPWAHLGIVPVAGPSVPTCFAAGYLDSEGGVVGQLILMALINLAVREEGAMHLVCSLSLPPAVLAPTPGPPWEKEPPQPPLANSSNVPLGRPPTPDSPTPSPRRPTARTNASPAMPRPRGNPRPVPPT
eukprot:EG_transcript_15040